MHRSAPPPHCQIRFPWDVFSDSLLFSRSQIAVLQSRDPLPELGGGFPGESQKIPSELGEGTEADLFAHIRDLAIGITQQVLRPLDALPAHILGHCHAGIVLENPA
jgi:hypothetical protein